jgi:hypothetical protein
VHISFRGLGCLALLAPLLFWALAVLAALSIKSYEPDRVRAGAMVLQTMAAGFGLGAAAIWTLARHRQPGRDSLAELQLRYWPWIWGVLALAALVASFSPSLIAFINDHSPPP